MPLRFVWDRDKDATNRRKHGFSLLVGAQVLTNDPVVLLHLHDRRHSQTEERWITIGPARGDNAQRLFFVVHAERHDDLIRIVSVRKATARERKNHAKR